MSKSEGSSIWAALWHIWFVFFIAIKLAGTSLAAWSWWWLLLPIVPCASLVVKHFGL